MKLGVNLRVRFREEKLAYTVQASSERFTICTKPFNPLKTVLYTIIDWEQGIRGPENLILGMGAESRKDCVAMLRRLERKEDCTEVSHRYRIKLDVQAILTRKPSASEPKKEISRGK